MSFIAQCETVPVTATTPLAHEGVKPVKMKLPAAGLLVTGTITACGGGGGHSKAYQDGYDEGLRGGSQAAGQTVTADFWCGGRSAAYQGSDSDRNDYVAGCKEGFAKGQSQSSSTHSSSTTRRF